MIVFDSSALLAVALEENGADMVNELLDEADVPKYLHHANAVEVLTRIARASDMVAAIDVLETFQYMGVQIRHDSDREFLRDVAALKADHNVALGDCFGVALARRLDAEFVTSDRAEMSKFRDADCCRVTFIR